MRRVLALGLLAALTGCVTTNSNQPQAKAPAMQMPAKPENTARIVVFRYGSAPVLMNQPPKPLLLINGETLGEAGYDTLYIRDVPPGDYEITMAIRIPGDAGAEPRLQSMTRRATLNAGGEWFMEATTSAYNCTGVRPVEPGNFGPNVVTAGSLVISFASIFAAMATTTCQTNLYLKPKWPKFGHEEINPLLAKYGALPLEVVAIPDMRLAKSGLSWPEVEALVRQHIDYNTGQYTPFIDKAGRGNLLVRDITLVSDAVTADATYTVAVIAEYLHVDEDTTAGRYVKRPLRYTIRREDDRLVVTAWKDGI